MKRRIIPPRLLAAENAAMTQFLFDVVIPRQGAKLPIQKVFDAYQKWRAENRMPETQLTVDGFGRLFPNSYTRGSAYWAPVKHALKCVFGLGLKNG